MTPVGVNLTNINFNIPRPFGQHQIDYILRIYRCNICAKTQTIPKTPFFAKKIRSKILRISLHSVICSSTILSPAGKVQWISLKIPGTGEMV